MRKIVLGLGNNIDYEIEWDSDIFARLIQRYEIVDADLSLNREIHDERDLVISVLSFLKMGKGGECFVANSQIIEDFSANFKKMITLGGTSVRAAIAMNKIGLASSVHLVTLNDDVLRLLPENSEYICSSTAKSCYPHLIIQYSRGTRIKASDIEIVCHRSNRIIYDNDMDNILMKLSDRLCEFVADAGVFLISGFNVMQDKSLLNRRLAHVSKAIDMLPEGAFVFYEDACFHDKTFPEIVENVIGGKFDLHSMNEDELQEYLGVKIDLLDPAQVMTALEKVRRFVKAEIIIVHTKYWALAYGENAKRYEKSLKGGICMAGTRFMHGDEFTAEDYRKSERHKLQKDAMLFSDKINLLMEPKICCLASLDADEERATTIGLGDAFVGGFLAVLAGDI